MNMKSIRENVIALSLLIVVLIIASMFSRSVERDPYRGHTNAEIESGIREQIEFGPTDTLTLIAEEGDYSRWSGKEDGGAGGWILVLDTKGGPVILATGQNDLPCTQLTELGIPVSLMETCVTEDGSTIER